MKLQWIDKNTYRFDGVEYNSESDITINILTALFGRIYVLIKTDEDGTFDAFRREGSSGSSGDAKQLLDYILNKDGLKEGTKATASSPPTTGARGFLTSTAESSFEFFFKFFGYTTDQYQLLIKANVEIGFLCGDRRTGAVTETRETWSPYFKISDLLSDTTILIQDAIVGDDTTAFYNLKGRLSLNANGALFITLTDTHANQNNNYACIVNIRFRAV